MAKMTQADRDAGLTQEDVDAGLRGGRNERISDEDRARALKNAGESIVDRFRDYDKNPEAKAIPVDMGNSPKPRPAAKPAPRQASAPLSREPMPNEIPSGYEPAPRRAPPSRGRYDQNGPIGDLMDLIRGNMNKPSPYRRGTSEPEEILGAKRGGAVNKMKKKSSVSSASKRGDGIATKGKTKGRFV